MSIQKQFFGKLPDGRAVHRYTLQNANGMTVNLLDFGGAIQQIIVPDKKGRMTDVVGGYDNVLDYYYGDGYQGALIGRWGNRICRGKFVLDGVTYDQLYTNWQWHERSLGFCL